MSKFSVGSMGYYSTGDDGITRMITKEEYEGYKPRTVEELTNRVQELESALKEILDRSNRPGRVRPEDAIFCFIVADKVLHK